MLYLLFMNKPIPILKQEKLFSLEAQILNIVLSDTKGFSVMYKLLEKWMNIDRYNPWCQKRGNQAQ